MVVDSSLSVLYLSVPTSILVFCAVTAAFFFRTAIWLLLLGAACLQLLNFVAVFLEECFYKVN